jgi:hypothetical protein
MNPKHHRIHNPLRLTRRPEPPGTRAQPVRGTPRSNRPYNRQRSILDSGRATKTRSWGTQPPHMRLTERRDTRGRPDRSASRNHTSLPNDPPARKEP